MPIWQYADRADELLNKALHKQCLFCKSTLTELNSPKVKSKPTSEEGWHHDESAMVLVCPLCGWWHVTKSVSDYPIGGVLQQGGYATFGAVSCLKTLDLADLATPINDVRSYLLAKYESRYTVHPRLFEETVASVLKDIGFIAEITAYSNDGGIDVILSDNHLRIGVQVKRYRSAIKVEQIRSLAGALVLGGLTKGIFVTTSDFQSGADKTVRNFRKAGYAIELMDSQRFYEALKLAQRPMYKSFSEFVREHPLNDLTEISRTVAF